MAQLLAAPEVDSIGSIQLSLCSIQGGRDFKGDFRGFHNHDLLTRRCGNSWMKKCDTSGTPRRTITTPEISIDLYFNNDAYDICIVHISCKVPSRTI
jgi:hypothetical protein